MVLAAHVSVPSSAFCTGIVLWLAVLAVAQTSSAENNRANPIGSYEPPMCPNERVEIWKERYIAAILEIDTEKVLLRVRAAKMAICDRVEELNGGGSASERAALNQAMKALGELQDIY